LFVCAFNQGNGDRERFALAGFSLMLGPMCGGHFITLLQGTHFFI